MKRCVVCGHKTPGSDLSCIKCGEASWAWVADVAPAAPAAEPAPKKGAKKKAKVVEPVAPAISDAEFEAELAAASDDELFALYADENLSPAWLKLIEAEVARRDSQS